ncbi:MAG: leucine-rich repeat domain-containing protein [Bacteroidetes bacterium]|nr:leucine-rich repeat domain-containing protein [Bacteroidota bacterium]
MNKLLLILKVKILSFTILIALLQISCTIYERTTYNSNQIAGVYFNLEAARKSPMKVEYLILNNKDLTTLPDEIYKMKNLGHLRIMYHDTLDLGDLFTKVSKHPTIKELEISFFNCKYFPDEILLLNNINKLSIIDSKNIDLGYLFEQLSQLMNLMYLNIAFGDFNSLPPEIGLLTNIKILELGANPIQNIPNEIQRLNIEKIIFCQYPQYFRLLPIDEKLKLLTLLPNTEIVLFDYQVPVGNRFTLGDREVKLTRDNLWEVKK